MARHRLGVLSIMQVIWGTGRWVTHADEGRGDYELHCDRTTLTNPEQPGAEGVQR